MYSHFLILCHSSLQGNKPEHHNQKAGAPYLKLGLRSELKLNYRILGKMGNYQYLQIVGS